MRVRSRLCRRRDRGVAEVELEHDVFELAGIDLAGPLEAEAVGFDADLERHPLAAEATGSVVAHADTVATGSRILEARDFHSRDRRVAAAVDVEHTASDRRVVAEVERLLPRIAHEEIEVGALAEDQPDFERAVGAGAVESGRGCA